MNRRVLLLVYSLLSLSLPSASFCGEEPIVTGPKADPLFRDEGAFTSQQIAIGKILAYPEDYDLRIVTLKGTVTRVNRPPWSDDPNASRPNAYSALRCIDKSNPLYTFDLEDETGTVQVGVFSSPSCFLGKTLYPLQTAVTEGDRIIAEVQIVIANVDATGRNHRTVGAIFSRGKRITD